MPPIGAWHRLEVGNLEIQNRQRQAVLVSSLSAPDLRLRLLQLRLAELHDGGQAQLVTGLGKVKGKVGLLQKLLADIEALVSGAGVEPASADVAGNAVLEVAQLLLGSLSPQLGFAGAVEEAIKSLCARLRAQLQQYKGSVWETGFTKLREEDG